MSKSLLICFAGKSCSGKTTISKAVAEILNCGYASFGDYVRAVVHNCGEDSSDREQLQAVGQCMIDKDPRSFCDAVLKSNGFEPGRDFVLDGIRHSHIPNLLDEIAEPSRICLIFLDIHEELRVARGRRRLAEEGSPFDLSTSLVADTESVYDLRRRSDIVLDCSTYDEDEAVSRCMQEIARFRLT